MDHFDSKVLESFIIPEDSIATESLNNNYPKELSAYKFTTNGKFDPSTKTSINEFFENSDWIKRLNKLFNEVLTSSKYNQKVKVFCNKTGYKLSDFKFYLLTVHFNENSKNAMNNNVYINITFDNIDRYDCPGFVSLVKPILSNIIKTEMGANWILEGSDYPTDFIIYRKLNSEEEKSLQTIQQSNDEIKKQKAAKNSKTNELYKQELKNSNEAFYKQSLKDQALEILKYFTFNKKWYYDNNLLKYQIPNKLKYIKSIKLNPDEKMIAFDYIHPNSFNRDGNPIQNKLTCYAITNKDSGYKKLVKLYYIYYDQVAAATFNTYIKSKVTKSINKK